MTLAAALSPQDANRVLTPNVMALTPVMDGVVSQGEWEAFTSNDRGSIFVQWEPGTLYWAGKVNYGSKMVVAIDFNNDGFTHGDDDVVIVVRAGAAGAREAFQHQVSQTADNPAAADRRWYPRLEMRHSTDYWNYEGELSPPNPLKVERERQIGVGVYLLPDDGTLAPGDPQSQVFPVNPALDSSQDLFHDVSWRPEIARRTVARVDPLKIRYNFVLGPEAPDVRTLDVVGEGYARSAVGMSTVTLRQPDHRRHTLGDYFSEISNDALGGYRIVRATLTDARGRKAVLRTSVQFVDLMTFEPQAPRIRRSDQQQTVKLPVTVRSQARGRIDATFRATTPAEWNMETPKDHNVLIYHPRGTAKVVADIAVPAGYQGRFPVMLTALVGEREVTRRVFLEVE